MRISYKESLKGFEFDFGIGKFTVTEKLLDTIKEGKPSGIAISSVVDAQSDTEVRKQLKYAWGER